jgi:hypothetical protein
MKAMKHLVSGEWSAAWTAGLVLLLAGCGGTGGGSAPAVGTSSAAPAGDYLPLSVGAVWTYQTTALSGASGQATVTVEAAENAPGGGQAGLRVHSVLPDGGTIAWEQTSGSAVVRFEEQQLDANGAVVVDKRYSPPILVLDESTEHLTSGAAWTESYMEAKTPTSKKATTKEKADWTVEAVNDSVTVPAGSYTCVRVRRNHTSSKTPSTTVSWYAIGVGKVKETGAGASNDLTLELTSTSLPK